MDEKQFSDIYKDYAPDLYRFCMFKVSNRQEAEDLTSEVFVDLYKQDLEEIGHVRGWLYKVARNKIYDHYNKSMKVDDSNVEKINNFDDSQFVSNLKATESIVIEESLIKLFEEELKNLDELNSEIIVLRLWEQLSFNEIADITNNSEGSVKKRFYRGVDQIKASLSMQVKNEKSYKLNSFAFIFAGVIGISSQPAYAFSAVGASLSAGLGSILGINLVNMAIAETTAVAATASTKTGIAAFLSTAAGKAAVGVVATATVITGGIGGYALTQSNNEDVEPEPVVQEEPQVEEVEENAEEFNYEIYESELLGIKFEIPEGNEVVEKSTTDPNTRSIIVSNSQSRFLISDTFIGGAIIPEDTGELRNGDANRFISSYNPNGEVTGVSYFVQNGNLSEFFVVDGLKLFANGSSDNVSQSQIEVWDRIIESIEGLEEEISEYDQNSLKFEELGFSIDLPEQESYDSIPHIMDSSPNIDDELKEIPREWYVEQVDNSRRELFNMSVLGSVEMGFSNGRYTDFMCDRNCGGVTRVSVSKVSAKTKEEALASIDNAISGYTDGVVHEITIDEDYQKFGENIIKFTHLSYSANVPDNLKPTGEGQSIYIVESSIGDVYIVNPSGGDLNDPDFLRVFNSIRFI